MKPNLSNPDPLLGYLIVGAIGFVVDGGVMQVLFSWFEFDALYARTASFPLAVTVTWFLNRNWTFSRNNAKVSHKRYLLYVSTQIFGALINVAVFAALVEMYAVMAVYPLLALAAAAVVALTVTYTASSHFIFAKPKSE